ncbi:glycosyltransferase family 4 protein [Mesorhizobium sp. L-8-3]|uniref:glycosyltransferase family 4 protein n=1 Tax=Mesorhizobium sp. L-8-3 TaxID=2744522 RepID=UPI0019294E65|nr:glycosyltransferase family 4 protein [Mesorhizobium sp. L-8-3]BCH26125.1 glucosyltransferase [Mesorhizobium sp. L-8-3]
MRIALGIHRLQPRGGLEDNCLRIAAELDRRGHEATLFVAGACPDVKFPVVSIAPRRKPSSNHARAAAFATAFVNATNGRFDRTVAFQPAPGAEILFLADALRNRADAPFLKRLTPRFRTFARLEQGCFDTPAKTRIIGVALSQMRAAVERYPSSRERVAVIPPAIAETRRRPELRDQLRPAARAELGLAPDEPAWLWLGLQPEIKGLDRVIEALPDHPRARLLVGGLGSGDHKMRKPLARAAQLGVGDRIRCMGYISGDRFFKAVAAADVLAHPARVEVAGAVILEAIVNGLPVVTTDICGFSGRILEAGAGKVVTGPFAADTFSRFLGDVGGAGNEDLSRRGIAYGANPELYSGVDVACDLIEAEHWPAPPEGL